jgi:DNA polymerase III delta subunit
MPEILYSQIKSCLNELKSSAPGTSLPSVVLIFGDEMLYKSTLQVVIDALIPLEKQSVSYEPMDGVPENVYAAIESLNTYSFFSDRKVVGFLDTRIFYAGER